MPKSSGNRSAASGKAQKQKPVYVTRYIGIDSHLIERNGSTDQVFGIAGEKPAGRKLAKDLATACNQLHAEGYEPFSVFPLVSGRVAEAEVEAAQEVKGRTHTRTKDGEQAQPTTTWDHLIGPSAASDNEEHFIDTGVGYSVTDGVVIIAKRRT